MAKALTVAKAVVAVLIPLGALLIAQVGDQDITNIWLAVVAVLTAAGVYAVPNKT